MDTLLGGPGPPPKMLLHMTFVISIMTEAIVVVRNSLGSKSNLLFSPTSLLSRTGVRLQCSSAFKGGFRGRAAIVHRAYSLYSWGDLQWTLGQFAQDLPNKDQQARPA